VRESELRRLFDAVAGAAAVTVGGPPARVRLASSITRPPQSSDSLSRYAELLSRLTDTYSVSGDEGPVREVLLARLPAWARDSAVVDTAGNLILAMGPDRDTVVFVAHMDEVGFDVVRAERDGIVTLRTRGGFFPTLFTGQTAMLHLPVEGERSRGCRPTSGTALRGVFLAPDSAARAGGQQTYRAWFGSQLARDASNVVGARVTSFKCSTRLGTTRFTARGIDDRAGSTALVMALESIDRARLPHKVIFVWSVREETGLDGARAAAAMFGPSVRRVHAVDTFVSADSPLETGRFAVTPIGSGAVLRVLDNSSIATPEEIERVTRIARAAGIPLQLGTTNGGTDASPFVSYGAANAMISWPLRYSHSPAELIDLRDIRSLVRLVAALANAPVK
jgi:putative aminopeptidase